MPEGFPAAGCRFLSAWADRAVLRQAEATAGVLYAEFRTEFLLIAHGFRVEAYGCAVVFHFKHGFGFLRMELIRLFIASAAPDLTASV